MLSVPLTLITPTGDRPESFALCEKWVGAQTFKDFFWIVVDDGHHETVVNSADMIIRPEALPLNKNSQGRNLRIALDQVDTPYVAIIEDDDYYRPDYLEKMMTKIVDGGYDIVGESCAFFYNIRFRKYKKIKNYRHAALCQTVLRKHMIPYLLSAIKNNKIVYDLALWQLASSFGYKTFLFPKSESVVGIKGMPGRIGIGRGHKDTEGWESDDDKFSILSEAIGNTSLNNYLALMQ